MLRAFSGDGGRGRNRTAAPTKKLAYLIAPLIADFFFYDCHWKSDRLPSITCRIQRNRDEAPHAYVDSIARSNIVKMKLSNPDSVSVYTVSGGAGKNLPDWLARRRKRHLKDDAEYQNRVELLQDFHFESASVRVRVSEDGNWVMSTGTYVSPQPLACFTAGATSY